MILIRKGYTHNDILKFMKNICMPSYCDGDGRCGAPGT